MWAWPLKLLHHFDFNFRTSQLDDPVAGRALARTTEITPGGAVITYTHPAFTVRQQIFAALNEPAVVMVLDVDAAGSLEIQAEFVPDLQLAWPGAAGGQYAYWDEADRAFLLSESQRNLNAYVGSPFASSATGQTEPGASEAPLRLRIVLGASEPGSSRRRLRFTGGCTCEASRSSLSVQRRTRDSVRAIYRRVLSSIPALYTERAAHARAVLDSTMWTESPDPKLDLAVRWAALNLDEALACNPDLGCGLVAGYGPSQSRGTRPGFAWYFGSDAAVTTLVSSPRDVTRSRGRGSISSPATSEPTVEYLMRSPQSAGRIKWFEDYPYAFYHAEDTPWWIVAWGEYWRETGDTLALRQAWPAIRAGLRLVPLRRRFQFGADAQHQGGARRSGCRELGYRRQGRHLPHSGLDRSFGSNGRDGGVGRAARQAGESLKRPSRPSRRAAEPPTTPARLRRAQSEEPRARHAAEPVLGRRLEHVRLCVARAGPASDGTDLVAQRRTGIRAGRG